MSAIATQENVGVSEPQVKRRQASLWRDAALRFSKNKLAMAGFIGVMLLVLMAILAPWITPYPYDYAIISQARKFPGFPGHILGTDEVGRDMLSRLMYGARISLTVGISVMAVATVIGVALGMAAGFMSGWVDYVVMRIVEVFTAIPQILFALFLVSIFGGGMYNIIFAIALISWVDICRLTRAQILTLREKEYVEAARTLGTPGSQIAWRHLLPNALTPLIIAITIGIPAAIFTEAGLSFLGVGINDPLPSWGKMVGNSQANVRLYWHLALLPTLLIAFTMLSFSLMGDGLRDALDPRSNKN